MEGSSLGGLGIRVAFDTSATGVGWFSVFRKKHDKLSSCLEAGHHHVFEQMLVHRDLGFVWHQLFDG